MPPEDNNAKWEKLQAQANRRYESHASKLRDPTTRMGAFHSLAGKANARLNKHSGQRKTPEEIASDLPESTSQLEGMERRLKRWTGKGAGLNLSAKGEEGKGLSPMGRVSQLAGLLPQVRALHERNEDQTPDSKDRDAFEERVDAFVNRHQKARESILRSREENRPTDEQKEAFDKKFQAFTERSEKHSRGRDRSPSVPSAEKDAFDKNVAAFMERWGGSSDDVNDSLQPQDKGKGKDGKAPKPSGGKTLSLPGGFKVPDLTGLSDLVKDIHTDTEERGPMPDIGGSKNKGRKDNESGKAKGKPGWRKLPGGFKAPDLGGLQGGLMDLAKQIHKDTEASRPKIENQGRKRSNAIVSDEFRSLEKEPKQDLPKEKNYRIVVSNDDKDHPSRPRSPSLGSNKASNPNLLQPPKQNQQPLYSQLSPRGSPLPPNLSNPSGLPGLGMVGGNPIFAPPLGPPKTPVLGPVTTPQHLMPPPLHLPNEGMPPGGPVKR